MLGSRRKEMIEAKINKIGIKKSVQLKPDSLERSIIRKTKENKRVTNINNKRVCHKKVYRW